ncbi:helicase with zinc finger domain 2-like [Mercenaria mercenaria]|uniref:helicase with zinc finger domain 2-like n=1 Tax=Mercenaria mercenaria TaxID=6596 RepID=UPI00234F1EA2|nr:helicase with zinc finger domain 2-like [Mercenaria mercenaria]XP_053394366.1 helicase with zinc finger domain 2-like [Mercenaria mercenaria]
MAETVDQLIFRADVALHAKKFSDVKKYVEQAVKQTDQERDDYLNSEQNASKEEELSKWYNQCAYILFQIADLWNSLNCTLTATIFSEKTEFPFLEKDSRWIKLLLQQPREKILIMHKTLITFLSERLGEVAKLAVRVRKWERSLQIDQIIDSIFIWLRDIHSIGPDMVWLNPGRYEAFLRMANCYFNLNDHDNTRIYCKLVLEHLSDYGDIKALEIFARSLLTTNSFRSALKYCKLAIDCCKKTGDERSKKRLQKLLSEIERRRNMAQSTTKQTRSKTKTTVLQNNQRVEELQNSEGQRTTGSKKRRRPNREKRLHGRDIYQRQVTKLSDDSDAIQEESVNIYERTSSDIENEQELNVTSYVKKTEWCPSESGTDTDNASISSSEDSDTEAPLSTSSDQEFHSSGISEDSESETDTASFYDVSRSIYEGKEQSHTYKTSISKENLTETVVHLDPSFLRKFEDRRPDVLRRKKLYPDMLPESELNEITVNDQKYIRGTIKIEGPHEAVCIPARSARCFGPIKILGRGKIGQTFNEDEVIVELLHNQKSTGKRFGKVVGIFDSKRHDNVKRNLFACTLDVDSYNLVRPICKTFPKIHVLNREISKKYRNETARKDMVEIYDYDKLNGTLKFSKIVRLKREERNSCVLIVAFISWSPRYVYPIGAIIEILPTGKCLEQDLLVSNIMYKVPSLYKKSTVKEVEYLLSKSTDEPRGNAFEGRTDLSDLWTYTIDPPDSEDLDDALSVVEIEHAYKVGVHIADVSSHVAKGSAVDVEAQNRSQTFYSGIRNARYMLPEPLSKDLCSLLPNKLRLTLTVFFYIDKKSFAINKTEIMKTCIKSKRKLTYKEVQDMISIQDTNTNDRTTTHIKRLFKMATILRKQRLKNASYALEVNFQESVLENDDIGTFEAHYLVEEFMVLANRTVAEKLLQSSSAQYVPIRCHNPPSGEEIAEFLKVNGDYMNIICKLQDKQIGKECPSFSSKCDTNNKDVMVFKTIWRAMLTNHVYATNYLRKDDLHPIQHVIYQNWLYIQEHAEYRCSGTVGEHEGKHYGLDIFRYTYFTSPIRRYIDLVVHRLVHSALFQDTPCSYSKEEIDDICQHANLVSKRAKDYERGCKTLKMATELGRKPRIFTCYVNSCTDGEITFCTPTLRGQALVHREIPFKLLDMAEKPVIKHDINTRSNKVRAVWSKRLYNFRPVISNVKLDSTQELNPYKDMFLVPMQQWVQLLRILTIEKADKKEICYTDIIENTRVVSSNGLHDVTTEHAVATEVEVGRKQQKSIVFQPSTKFSMSFSRGQRLNIQMTAVQKKGTTVLKASLLNLTDNVKFCLQHTDDPVLYLSRYTSNATRDRYKDVKTYRDIWLPILSMEASKGVLKNEESCCLNDRPIKFSHDRTGKFVLDEEDCEMRNIEFSGTFFEDSNRNEYKAPSYDWLCIKTSRPHAVRDDLQCTATYIWVGHGEITRVEQKSGKLVISFILHETSKADDIIFNQETRFHIEILKKSEVDKRTESFIQELEKGSLAANIALRKPISDLDDDLVQIANKMDTDLFIKIKDDNAWKPLPRNNAMQKAAICKALKSRFTLIQGPPGTGKTQTAIKLICLFTKVNNTKQRKMMDRNQVLFCGPSNKSVDLVAKWMLNRMGEHRPKFVRVYGRTIETEKFPIPGKNFVTKRSTKNQAADPELESVSLHHLIRKPENTFSERIKEFDKLFAVNKNKPMPIKEKEYAKLIAKASIEEMKKYDVILCTTAVGTNPKLLRATDISQIIVDEAGMCPEPNCLVPIIATNAKQVVLIGDHKQLRPIVMCKEAAVLGLETSLFERYATDHSSTNVAFIMLNEQYRMNPEICSFPSEQFYDGALKTGKGRWCEDPMNIWPSKGRNIYPHVFVQIEGEEEVLTVSTEEGNEQSRSNLLEAKHVVKVYSYFTREQPSDSVQIISQYNAQCHEIRTQLKDEGFVDVNVSTVVSSQGGEWDYVIFSTVRSLPHYKIERNPTIGWCKHNLGFITDRNQVNVALTRAKKGLIIIGNKQLLSCDEVWKDLIDCYGVRGCILTPDQFPPPFKKTRQQIMAEAKQKHHKRHGDAIFEKGEATSFKGPIDEKPKVFRGFRKK